MMSDFSEKVKSANRGVSRWARRTGSVVTQWWEEVNTVQERRSRMRRLARERRQLLTDMGSKVYTLHRKGKVQNRDLLADCGKIDQIGEDIERLEEEIAEIKRARAAAPREVEVEDEAPIVADEDADVSAGEVEEAPAEEPEEAPAEEPERSLRRTRRCLPRTRRRPSPRLPTMRVTRPATRRRRRLRRSARDLAGKRRLRRVRRICIAVEGPQSSVASRSCPTSDFSAKSLSRIVRVGRPAPDPAWGRDQAQVGARPRALSASSPTCIPGRTMR